MNTRAAQGKDSKSEDSLEPVGLIRQSGAILRMGKLMLSSGTASYRVKEAMQATATALGIDRHAEHVTLTEITATSHRGKIFRTEVAEVRSITVNVDRISRLDALGRSLPADSTPESIHAALDAIEARPALYRPWLNALFAGFACLAFALLNNARVWEAVAVLVAATCGQYLRRALIHGGFNPFGATMLSAGLSCVIYLGATAVVDALAPEVTMQASGYVSAVLFLVPGFPVVTGALDLVKMDFSAGLSRVVYAIMILGAAAISVWAVAIVAGLDPVVPDPAALSHLQQLWLHAGASALGVFGFALMFNSPPRFAIAAALIGMVANVFRIEMVNGGMLVQSATMIACIGVGVAAAIAAARMKVPVITLSVPATLIMVPGITAYHAVASLNDGRNLDAWAQGMQAAFVLISIVVGLVVAKLVTDKAWTIEKPAH